MKEDTTEASGSQGEHEDTKVLESPLAHKGKAALIEEHVEIIGPAEQKGSANGSQVEVAPPGLAKDEISKPSSPAEAFELKIDYPAFQTSGILEFEPDFLEVSGPSSTQPVSSPQETASLLAVDSTTESAPHGQEENNKGTQLPKPKGKRSNYVEFLRRRRPRRTLPPLPELPIAERGTRPALAVFFEKYDAPFLPNRRPYLQLTALKACKLEKDSNFDTVALREEFHQAFKVDMEYEWPQHEVMRSHIDNYFFKFDGTRVFKDEVFVYDPSHEGMAEFLRLSLEAKWISQIPQWDVKHWNESLKVFDEIWSDKNARIERGRFKDACFHEFDQVCSP
jgi:hypothetical protein